MTTVQDWREGEELGRRQARRLLAQDAGSEVGLHELALRCIEAAASSTGEQRELLALALKLLDLEDRRREHARQNRHEREAAIEQRLATLRRTASSTALLDRVCRDIVEVCGFSRAMIGRVSADQWLPWMVHFSSDPTFENEFVTWIRGTAIPLAEAPPEQEALLLRRAVLVADTTELTHRPIVLAGRTRSYVVAPLVPAGRVVGFLHADHFPTTRHADEADRDALGMFAEGFGRIYERAVLSERLRAQGARVRAALDVAEAIAETFTTAEIGMAGETSRPQVPPLVESRLPTGHSKLTEREEEVFRLIVRGFNNRAIAAELAIREGTVKSHVKQILRKLGATNRTQAIARYLNPPT